MLKIKREKVLEILATLKAVRAEADIVVLEGQNRLAARRYLPKFNYFLIMNLKRFGELAKGIEEAREPNLAEYKKAAVALANKYGRKGRDGKIERNAQGLAIVDPAASEAMIPEAEALGKQFEKELARDAEYLAEEIDVEPFTVAEADIPNLEPEHFERILDFIKK